MSRLTAARLAQLATELPTRYTIPLTHLARARVLSGGQLDRLLTPALAAELGEQSAGRVRRRIMGRLADLGLVTMTERRIGGIRAGSTGHVHVLTPAGYTLTALLSGERPPGRVRRSRNPGPMFLNHALATAETYVQLVEASHAGGFRVATFVTEPGCWWPAGHGLYLKPDAYLALQTASYRDCWWLEIDQATESLPRVQDKIRTYHDHAEHGGLGPDEALPRILFATPDGKRAAAIRSAAAKTSTSEDGMISVTTHQQAVPYLIGELHKT